MVSDEEMLSDSVWSLFRRFTFPAMAGILVAGIQTIIDGVFIGNGVGSDGLAGVTLAFPFVMFIVAAGIMIGMGSASLVALELGRSHRDRARGIMSNVFPLVFAAGLVITAMGLFLGPSLIGMFDTSDTVRSMSEDYMNVIFMGSVFIILALTLDPLVRNDGYPLLAMRAMILAVLVNIVLDYVFVIMLDMQLFGAALATVLAFGLSASILSMHFFSSKTGLRVSFGTMRFQPREVLRIVESGLPSFAMQLSVAVLFLAHNFVLLQYGDEGVISAYGIIGYSFAIFYMMFEGVAVGVQPIVGFNYGAGRYDRVRETLKLAMAACVAIGSIGVIIVYLVPEMVVGIFNPDTEEILETTVIGMKIIVASLLVQGIVVVNATYYQSINRVGYALFIHLGKIFVFMLPLLLALPMFFGLHGVWFATPVADYLMFAVVMVMLYEELKVLKGEKLRNP
ncbi:MAG: MATE family efflux transporter [Methanolobus sp.]|uniref:MATE family efflux transporter n=1 Tax=Methanolobus sp. TaxID=1874737 RepID=UPI00272FD1D1|nr:MATE family efflux transporter [Methanolobus sp.]MDP2217302.1 MATE family efflux transporter [Methanolobus sp.]